ncbi:hypothetical protein BDV25DRAFT_127901 [Aspergillus avenaceus]|uniref:SWIM-type domain-containing protein n=1 Tax=Aspergillus avenaceus TaxID=36643 RepID=A0A5N6U1S0_ASPAV|nr:hypothetical protein BDV25DRAFT_127901 [Aspergillus avenaceus]
MEADSYRNETGGQRPTGFSALRGQSGITYDLANLGPESGARAFVGLTTRFVVVVCYRTETGFDFLLSDQPRVHIDSNGATCTCSTFATRPVACQHIFWLVDQLHGCLTPRIPVFNVPLSSDGQSPALARIERLLDGKLEIVAEQLEWQYVRSEVEGGMSRPQRVRDLMSSFDEVLLPEEFRPDLISNVRQSRTPEQCAVQGDYAATMFRLAVHHDTTYSTMCRVMPAGAAAPIYFNKMQERSRQLLKGFDEYCETGRRSEGSIVDVDEVIEELQRNVYRIQANIDTRTPHGVEGAAKALVTLLEDICTRNKDALEGNQWGGMSFHGEERRQRNLYYRLIGETEQTGDCFILDALDQFTGLDLYQFGGRLQAILHRVEMNGAPAAYLLRLTVLVQRAESKSSSSGQKRPSLASSSGQIQSKRTR